MGTEGQAEPTDYAGNLGWGNGKLYYRISRETVQLIVFRQDEMVCAILGALGVAILISVPFMELCEFLPAGDYHIDENGREAGSRFGRVQRERWFLAPMSWMVPTCTQMAEFHQ